MTKLDITHQTRYLDGLIESLDNPLHRRIISNYREHAIFEITGNGKKIFTPEMTVENPVYWLNLPGEGLSLTLTGTDEVLSFYNGLGETHATVMVVMDERIAVADWGFASEGVFHNFQPGHALDASIGADPDKLYMQRRQLSMIWPYDERGRLVGEHVYEHLAFRSEYEEVPPEDFITLDEAREKLLPLLKPLPDLTPASV